MIKKKEIKKLLNLSSSLLKKRPNLSNLGNNFLFLQSAHPFHLSKYKLVDSKSLNIFFFFKYFFELSKNIIKIFLFFFKIIFERNYTNINNNSKKKIIIVSHLTSIKNFKKNIDTQYFGIEKKLDIKKSIFFYLDHIKTSNNEKSYFLNTKKNIFINNDCIKTSTFRNIIYEILREGFYIFNQIKKKKTNFEKKFYLENAKYLFSLSTIKNIILYYNLEKLIIEKKIKNILITFEGHPYEFLIFLLGKKYKIKIFAYQNGYITKDHYSIFLNLGNNFLPSKILANGKFGYDFFKKKFKSTDIILLGSNKYKKRINRKKISNFNLLVIPSAYEGEASEFIELCHNVLKTNKNPLIKIIFRLHPQTNKSDFISKNSDILYNEDRIKISDSSLINDITMCKFALYRSSSSIVDALQQGLIPIFFHEKKFSFQSDPLWQLNSKIVVKNFQELSKVLHNKNYINKRKYLEYKNFVNNYYKPINYRKLSKLF